MKKQLILLVLILFSAHSWSDDAPRVAAGYDPVVDSISDQYDAGRYLIYDCASKHWVCVTEEHFIDCKEKRLREKDSESVYYSCAALGALPTKKSCFQRQLYLVTHAHGQRFCVKDAWKDKSISY